MIYKADEATYDANGRSVRETKVSDVGRGILFVRGDGNTNASIAIRIINNVAHFQRRIGGVWQDTPLEHG
jgi:hypothetical protein